jgi:hypothetical protein
MCLLGWEMTPCEQATLALGREYLVGHKVEDVAEERRTMHLGRACDRMVSKGRRGR